MKQNMQKIVIYKDARGDVKLKADVRAETLWATQAQIAQLFGVDRTVATKHIRNIFSDGEVNKKSNVQKMHIPHSDKPITVAYCLS